LFWICVTEQYATQTSFVSTTSISSSSSKVSVTVGGIVGGVVGAVVLLGVVAGFIIWYKIRTRRPTMALLSETGNDELMTAVTELIMKGAPMREPTPHESCDFPGGQLTEAAYPSLLSGNINRED